jgi:hypothetical protein
MKLVFPIIEISNPNLRGDLAVLNQALEMLYTIPSEAGAV